MATQKQSNTSTYMSLSKIVDEEVNFHEEAIQSLMFEKIEIMKNKKSSPDFVTKLDTNEAMSNRHWQALLNWNNFQDELNGAFKKDQGSLTELSTPLPNGCISIKKTHCHYYQDTINFCG